MLLGNENPVEFESVMSLIEGQFGLINNVVDVENELREESQSDHEPERDRMYEDMKKDYTTDSDGPNNKGGMLQKMSSTRVVIRPSKFNL